MEGEGASPAEGTGSCRPPSLPPLTPHFSQALVAPSPPSLISHSQFLAPCRCLGVYVCAWECLGCVCENKYISSLLWKIEINSNLLTKVILNVWKLSVTSIFPCLHARQMVDVYMGRVSMSSSRKAVMNKSGPGGTALTVNIDAGDEYIPARRETLSRSLGLGEFW